MIQIGISQLPPEGVDDDEYLDRLVEAGYDALELPFVTEFPWKEKRCAEFGAKAAERGIRLSVHAPYFATLTPEDFERGAQCLAALEHTMKLGKALGARIVVAHGGATHGEPADVLMERITERLEKVAPKVEHLGVGLGLETAGKEGAWGTLGDIALVASRFSFVRPVVDWAHIHAITGGGLTTKEAFAQVLAFLVAEFPAWMVDPLHSQFTDNLVGEKGEVRHLPYGEGTLRVGPLVEAAREADIRLVIISEAREEESHRAIAAEAREAASRGSVPAARRIDSGKVDFPALVRAVPEGDRFRVDTPSPLTISNPDKLFFPDDGYTKGDVIQYYASVADVLLPHLAGRPISMSRYPDGIEGPQFYEKRAPGHQPDWMPTAPVPSDSQGGVIDFLLADRKEGLMWFANMGCIEIHPFHSRAGSLENPDYAIFDLDPAEGAEWEQVVAGALLVRVALEQLGMAGYPKLSGARGIHVYVPIEPIYTYERVRRFVGEVGRYLVAANPDDLTMEWDKRRRVGKVFVDHNRNASGQTIASVYSVRPRPGAPVSVPIRWEEVSTLRNGDITIANLWDRLQRFGDLFAPVAGPGYRLEEAEKALGLAPV
ncbi:MAG TPA: non-homologous end-joining DNA ligase [Acidimicrobiia bacterium]|nr:non-homologous end-joining DNA ligase [Acidimicrobiia bacterium]